MVGDLLAGVQAHVGEQFGLDTAVHIPPLLFCVTDRDWLVNQIANGQAMQRLQKTADLFCQRGFVGDFAEGGRVERLAGDPLVAHERCANGGGKLLVDGVGHGQGQVWLNGR